MPPRERVAGETPTAVPVSLRLSRVMFCFLRVLCALCGFPSPCPPWFSFSGLLTSEISPAREDFHAATGASCRRGPNCRPRSVAALSRCVSFSPCPLCPLWFSFPVSSVVFLLRTTNPGNLPRARRFSCRHGSELPARPQPPSPFRCGSLALCFVFSVPSVPSVVFLLRVKLRPCRAVEVNITPRLAPRHQPQMRL